jgi:transcription elongation factor GreA
MYSPPAAAVVRYSDARFQLGPCIAALAAVCAAQGYARLLGSAVHAVEPPGSKTDNLATRTPRNRHKEHDEMTDTQVTWLTQESHDRLKAELDQLIANRPVIAAEINDRREEGDLRENGGYHAAREEQGQQEARIRQLQDLLNNAKVGEAPKQSGVALPGSVVKVYYDGDKSDTETFLIATRQEGVNEGKLEVYSPNSPLGGALIEAKVGETRTYTVPNGNTVKVTLVSAEPYHA